MSEHLWDRDDLVQRVLAALRFTEQTVRAAAQGEVSDRLPPGVRSEIRPLVRAKVIGESTLLLRAAAHLADLDDRVAAGVDQLALLVAPPARDEDVRTAMCLEPGRAHEHAFAHILLTDAGYPDPEFDRLLEQSSSVAHRPERLPTRELEQEWLHGIQVGTASTSLSTVLRRSYLARPLDALAADAHEHYSFTHAVLYASDIGRAEAELPRPDADIAADADAALASSLDAGHHDLTAELLWTWPMLGLPWTPAATFAFTVLVELQDGHGFLPGPAYRDADRRALPTDAQDEYVLRSSYHTTLVMGMLCAAALIRGRRPERTVPRAVAPCGGAAAVHELLRPQPVAASWQSVYARLEDSRRDSLGDLLVAIALRRARRNTDLGLVREILTLALRHGRVDAPAPRQAVGLLRRAAAALDLSAQDVPEPAHPAAVSA